jgi:multiple antibiotic resistance protein
LLFTITNVSILNSRRLVKSLVIFLAILILTIGLWFGSGILQQNASTFAAPSNSSEPIQEETQPQREGIQYIAEEVAQSSFKDEFGVFNLFIIFFVTLGPLKVIPTFVQLTQEAGRSLRRQLAVRSTAVSTVVILLVVLIGRNILEVWQIQLPSLMIAGGILLSVVALQLVLTQYGPNQQQPVSPDPPDLHLAITPLAFPTILPPFGIAIALTLMIVSTELGLNPWVVIFLLLIVMGLNLISMVAARPIFKFVRPVTLKILGFTLGVMQFALGIQFILTGLEIQTLVIQILLKGQ